MNIAILGTGAVGRAHAEKLSLLGHQVAMGTRNANKTLQSDLSETDEAKPFSQWLDRLKNVKLCHYLQAAEEGEIVINALNGTVAVAVLTQLQKPLREKILIDIANPLDSSNGFPPFLSVCNTDSLGEQIQTALPETKIVKTLNTVTADIQVNPQNLNGGDHDMFLCGKDASAKIIVTEVLRDWYGWNTIIDLGDITKARNMEMLLPIWINLWQVSGTPYFNFKIISN